MASGIFENCVLFQIFKKKNTKRKVPLSTWTGNRLETCINIEILKKNIQMLYFWEVYTNKWRDYEKVPPPQIKSAHFSWNFNMRELLLLLLLLLLLKTTKHIQMYERWAPHSVNTCLPIPTHVSIVLWILLCHITCLGVAVGWGTALQFGRSRVRFPMVSLEFFIDTILPHYDPGFDTASNRNE